MILRDERPADVAAIAAVNRAAFGGEDEANIVDRLRDAGALTISVVAENEGQVVGHIAGSPATLGRAKVVGLAPMAVLPDHQRQGIGSQLIAAFVDRARTAGNDLIIVLGHADYYPRFGFRPAHEWNVKCPFDAPPEAFMLLPLNDKPIPPGTATYHPVFG